MKFSNEHYAFLSAKVADVVNNNKKSYLEEVYAELSKRRFRWDLFWASNVKIGNGVGIDGDINGDYNDEHIDTALRAIVKEFNLEDIGK